MPGVVLLPSKLQYHIAVLHAQVLEVPGLSSPEKIGAEIIYPRGSHQLLMPRIVFLLSTPQVLEIPGLSSPGNFGAEIIYP